MAYYVYDVDNSLTEMPGQGSTLLGDGRLYQTYDRAAHTSLHYDVRGRVTLVERQIAKPGTPVGTPASDVASRYTNHTFRAWTAYDDLDRAISQTTGADVPELLQATTAHPEGESTSYTNYSARGTVQSIGSSYGPIVGRMKYDADGAIRHIEYGDEAQTVADYEYDGERRLSRTHIWRPSLSPLDLEDTRTTYADYDRVGNPLKVEDKRDADKWEKGSKPTTTTTATYDDFYRVTSLKYVYGPGDDEFKDPEPANASPRVESYDTRVRSRSFDYDTLGNVQHSDDDRFSRVERSFGTAVPSSTGPNILASTELMVPQYDAAGELTELLVGPKLVKSLSLKYDYEWDEVGRLSHASRFEWIPVVSAKSKRFTMVRKADLRYTYDATGARVLKAATVNTDEDGRSSTTTTTAEIFPSLRLNHAAYDQTANDYERTSSTETAYLGGVGALARVLYVQTDSANATSGTRHVFLELADRLGSTSIVLDKDTGELVERLSYMAYGGVDSDFRPAKWANFHEDYKFTGKEDDSEVGLTYFGARYYAPKLMRFISADPLAIHGLGGDPNPYAYVRGRVTLAYDPNGLDCDGDGGGDGGGDPGGGGGDDDPVGGDDGGNDNSGGDGVVGASAHIHPQSSGGGSPCPPPSWAADYGQGAPGWLDGAMGQYETASLGDVADWAADPMGIPTASGGLSAAGEFAEGVGTDLWNSGMSMGAALAVLPALGTAGGVSLAMTLSGMMSLPESDSPHAQAGGWFAFGASMVLPTAGGVAGKVEGAAARGIVALDSNAVIGALQEGQLARVDAAIAGRMPVVPISAAKEFIAANGRAGTEALRQFLVARGGRLAAAGSESTAAALRARATGMGRVLRLFDSRIAAGAMEEGSPLITNDKKFFKFLGAIGYMVEGW